MKLQHGRWYRRMDEVVVVCGWSRTSPTPDDNTPWTQPYLGGFYPVVDVTGNIRGVLLHGVIRLPPGATDIWAFCVGVLLVEFHTGLPGGHPVCGHGAPRLGHLCLHNREPLLCDRDAATQMFRYRLHSRNTFKSSIVERCGCVIIPCTHV